MKKLSRTIPREIKVTGIRNENIDAQALLELFADMARERAKKKGKD